MLISNSKTKASSPDTTSQPSLQKQVDALLARMTLHEKVGQMTQINLNVVLEGSNNNMDGKIDETLLREAITQYHIGSMLNAINRAYSLDEWHRIISHIQDIATNETRLGIPVLYGIDSIHGATFTLNSTLFPQNIGLAATRNPDLVKEAARITACETRASGIRWNFDPVLDIGRNPLWSRFPETFGEDVYLTRIMGVAKIRGYENDDLKQLTAVASCMKHFIGYSAPASGKDRSPAHIPEIMLREYFLPQFQAAVAAGSPTIMINSGEVNGIPVHASHYLLTEVLRNEMGFKGLAVSDWEDVIRLHERHRVASTPKEAVKMAVMAGLDMSMVPHDYTFCKYLVELVEEGQIPEDRIDLSVRRILEVKFRVGLMDNAYPEPAARKFFGKPEYAEVALAAARESITLLKNEAPSNQQAPVLPLPKGKKILVCGPGAKSRAALHGAWSYTWQGDNERWYPESTITLMEAIQKKIGKENVLFTSHPGFGNKERYYWQIDPAEVEHPEWEIDNKHSLAAPVKPMKSELRDLALEADYVVLCLGENAYAESPGAIDDLALPTDQMALAKIVLSTGTPTVLVLTEGRPRIVHKLVQHAEGVLLAYQPGSKGAEALADVLFGDYNPDGRLPFTYPRSAHDFVLYDRKLTDEVQELAPGIFTYQGYKPEFEFGAGLSYTTFTYSDIRLSSGTLAPGETLLVTVDVSNTGPRAGKVATDLFTRDLFASITPSLRRLRKFQKVYLEPGETATLDFELRPEDLAFVNAQHKTITEPGEFEIQIADKKALFTYTG